jgi:cell division protease FtsH
MSRWHFPRFTWTGARTGVTTGVRPTIRPDLDPEAPIAPAPRLRRPVRGLEARHQPRPVLADALDEEPLDLEAFRYQEISPVQRTDIVGLDEVIEAIDGQVQRLAHPEQLPGAEAPRGLLFYGPPGTGKTLMARYLASSLTAESSGEVPFYIIPSDLLTPFRFRTLIRDLDARPGRSLLYLDEADNWLREPHSDDLERPEMQLAVMSALDGFHSQRNAGGGAYLVVSTNLSAMEMPGALLRGGRISHRFEFQLPGRKNRQALFQLYLGRRAGSTPAEGPGPDLDYLARLSSGMSGAGIRSAIDDAAAGAAKAGRSTISLEDLLEAIASGGSHRSEEDQKPIEQRLIVHELGHAIVSSVLLGPETVHGLLFHGGEFFGRTSGDEDLPMTESLLLADMAIDVAGRLAEETILGDTFLGNSDDFSRLHGTFDELRRNGRWPELPVRNWPWRNETSLEELGAEFRAWQELVASVVARTQGIIDTHRTVFLPLVERIRGRKAVGAAEWLALAEEFAIHHDPTLSALPRDISTGDLPSV